MLDDSATPDSRTRYLLETILCTLGIPFLFAGDSTETNLPETEGCISLLVGSAKGSALHRPGTVPLPEIGADLLATSRGPAGTPAPTSMDQVFALLVREEEYTVDARDEHDRFRWSHSSLALTEPTARPLVSEYCHLLLAALKEGCARAGLPMIRKEFWPRGREMAACLSHDVDVVRRGKLPRGIAVRDVSGALSSAVRGQFGPARKQLSTMARTVAGARDPYWTFERIQFLERELGYRSTYFFMAGHQHREDATYDLRHPHMTQLLNALSESGCEVALHGSYASYKDEESLRLQKAHLQTQLGEEMMGHRNHFLRFRVPDSWRAQESAGFSYDSSLGFADREGFRGGHAFPFHPYDLASEQSLRLLEIPLAVMDVTLQKYRRLRGEKAEQAVQAVLQQTRAVKGLATLLWHNDTFYEPDYPGCGRLYETTLSWLAENDVYVAPCREIDRWWRAREAVKLSPLPGERTGWRLETPQSIEGLMLRVSLPDSRTDLRVRGQAPMALRREGADHLLEFERLPAGFVFDIEYT